MKKTTAYARKLKHTAPRLNPLIVGAVRSQVSRSITELATSAGLHGMIGDNTPMLLNQAGRLCFIVCHAASACGFSESPEVRILRGTAESLGDVNANPESLHRLRGSINSGVVAAQRILPKLDEFALAMASLELDAMLAAGRGMGTHDIERALTKNPLTLAG